MNGFIEFGNGFYIIVLAFFPVVRISFIYLQSIYIIAQNMSN